MAMLASRGNDLSFKLEFNVLKYRKVTYRFRRLAKVGGNILHRLAVQSGGQIADVIFR